MDIVSYLPGGFTASQLLFFLSAAATFLGTVGIWLPLVERQPSGRRVKALRERRDALLAESRKPKTRGLKATGIGVAWTVVERLRLLGSAQADLAHRKMQQAGHRSKDAVVLYLFAKLALPGAFGGVAAILLYATDLYPLPPLAKAAFTGVSVMIGFYLPDVYVKNATDKRKHALTRGLPDALDLLVICAEAGLNLDSALVRVAREIRIGAPELADELELTSIELNFLGERRTALQNLEARTGLVQVGSLVSTLGQAERYGTPLAQSLRVMAAEMRTQRLMKAEEKAARLPATLTVPMIMFIMPALFIVLIGPGALRTIDALTGL